MPPTGYSEKVMDHFRNPRNVGTFDDPDGVGVVGNPVCGDLMEIQIKVKDDVITDIRFKTFGCGSAIATSSMITEMARGKTLEEAMRITRNDVAAELDGLPPQKMHCSNLAADALKKAIRNYLGEDAQDADAEDGHHGDECAIDEGGAGPDAARKKGGKGGCQSCARPGKPSERG